MLGGGSLCPTYDFPSSGSLFLRDSLANLEAIEELPIAPEELLVLKASSNGTITQGKTGLPAESRQAVIQGLVGRGLLKAVEKKNRGSLVERSGTAIFMSGVPLPQQC